MYYIEFFFDSLPHDKAKSNLIDRFIKLLPITIPIGGFNELEETEIAPRFTSQGYHFLGGMTGPYFGPYIWSSAKQKQYTIELPDGNIELTVQLNDDFISRSWLAYISFGQYGTGGWTNPDTQIINCVASAWDLERDSFRVSLLKHEGQYMMDGLKYGDMDSVDLEYRAKLVELIYTSQQNLLNHFIRSADSSNKSNYHGIAETMMVDKYIDQFGPKLMNQITNEDVQAYALVLLKQSNAEMDKKYIRALPKG